MKDMIQAQAEITALIESLIESGTIDANINVYDNMLFEHQFPFVASREKLSPPHNLSDGTAGFPSHDFDITIAYPVSSNTNAVYNQARQNCLNVMNELTKKLTGNVVSVRYDPGTYSDNNAYRIVISITKN